MNITTKGRYALRIMIDLAQQGSDAVVSLKSISERQEISMKYLESIAASLNKAGIIAASRGKNGHPRGRILAGKDRATRSARPIQERSARKACRYRLGSRSKPRGRHRADT